MMRKATRRASIIAILLTLAMLLSTASAFAKGPGGGSSGGRGSRGGGGTETVPNNLSVPAIMIGSGGPSLRFACGDPQPVIGTPKTGYPIDPTAYYYLQGESSWQASCNNTLTSATVVGAWGDNLTGDASLRVGAPIRVEMGLLVPSTDTSGLNMTGYTVDKLEPDALDRVSAYGTKALVTETGFAGNPITPYTEVRVWVADTTLTLTNPANVTTTLPMTAEINATGRIVYGYNLTVETAGSYTLKFTVPSSITVNGVDSGDVIHNADGTTTFSLLITVATSSAGGGGGGKGGGGRG